jgi:hypothetical protein
VRLGLYDSSRRLGHPDDFWGIDQYQRCTFLPSSLLELCFQESARSEELNLQPLWGFLKGLQSPFDDYRGRGIATHSIYCNANGHVQYRSPFTLKPKA